MAQEWYYTTHADQQNGPVNGETLKRLASSGELRPTDLIWREGMPQWIPASRAKALFPENAVQAPTAPPVTQAPERPSHSPPPPLPAEAPIDVGGTYKHGARPSWLVPAVIGAVVLVLLAIVAVVIVVRAALSASGYLGPSDGDIKEAVTRYYTIDKNFGVFDGYRRFPGGRESVQYVTITEVQVMKRGKRFAPREIEFNRPFGATSDGFPVRVFVKGTFREIGEQSNEPFEGEMDFVFYYIPPYRSGVDPEPGHWWGGPN